MRRVMYRRVVIIVVLAVVPVGVNADIGCDAPDTSFVSKPSAVVYAPDVQFGFKGTAPGIPVGFYCCFDSDCIFPPGPVWEYTPVDSPVVNSGVSLGVHTFAVATKDGFPPGPVAADPYPAYFAFCYADPLDDQGEDEYNNDKVNATVIDEAKVVRGNNKGNGEDWFKITNRRPGVSEMTVWTSSGKTVSVSVYDWHGYQLAGYTVPKGATEPSHAKFGVSPGDYFVKIAEDYHHGGDYELVVYFSELPCWQLLEVNPHYDVSGHMSNYLPFSVAMRGNNKHNEDDYYYLTVGDVPTQVTLELKSYSAKVTAQVLDAAMNAITKLKVTGNAGEHKCSEAKEITAPGMYFVRIDGDYHHGGVYEVHVHSSVPQGTVVAGLPPHTRIAGASLGRVYDISQEFIWTAMDDGGYVEYAFQTDEDPDSWSAWTTDISTTLCDYLPGAHWIAAKSSDNAEQEDYTPHWAWFLYASEFNYEGEYNNDMRFANPVEQGMEIRGNNKGDGDDWFVLVNQQPGLGVLAVYLEGEKTVTMYLHDRHGNEIGSTSVHSNWRYGSCLVAAPPGQYYVKIGEDYHHGGDYKFVAGFVKPPRWWTTEFTPYNHDKHRPNPLPFGVQVKGTNKDSDDYYCFTLSSVPTDLTTWCHNEGRVEMRLYGPDGAEIKRWNPLEGNDERFYWPRVYEKGTYLVRILQDYHHGGDYVMTWWVSDEQAGSVCGRRPNIYLTGYPLDIADGNSAEFLWYAEDCSAVGGFTYQVDGEEFSCKTTDIGVILSDLTPGGHYLAASAIDNTRRVDKRPWVAPFLYADTERDEVETNSGKTHAETIVPGQWVRGNNKSDDDWFTFEDTQAGLRHVIVVLESTKKVTVKLLDGALFEHASSSCHSDARRQSFVAAIGTGTYFLMVPQDYHHGGDYRVAFGYVDVPSYYRNEYETNNSCPEANVISRYQYVAGINRSDDDFYKFPVSENELPLTVQLWLRGYPAKATAILYDPNGHELGCVSVNGSNTDAKDFDLAKPGVYCIKVLEDYHHGGRYAIYVDPRCEPSWVRFPCDYSTYDDWLLLGKPACWNSAFQCDGDCDCKTQGFQEYRVFTNDLECLKSSWKKRITHSDFNPCADFDHKAQGFQKYRVFTNDLEILVRNWKKKDKDLACNCPRPE